MKNIAIDIVFANKFEKENLVINESGDNKIYFFLNQNDFLNKYPEFRPKESEILQALSLSACCNSNN